MVNELVQELIVPLILTIAGASFAGAASVAWWGIKRMVTGQDKINETLTEIRDQLSATSARVGQLETREELREKVNNERHEENKTSIKSLWKAVREKPIGGHHVG